MANRSSWLSSVADAHIPIALASYRSRGNIHQSGSEFRVVGCAVILIIEVRSVTLAPVTDSNKILGHGWLRCTKALRIGLNIGLSKGI
ncbi:MAG: hypothetical protein F6K65_05575 [Moorea sp. SIO3C2]|nr:hypothetical protein [Moorena sp. SIO3C2]